MNKYFVDPNDFSAQTDCGNIQAAVDEAVRTGCNHVVIPAYNRRTGKYLWEIHETIKLPSHIYIEIDNAHLRMADGVMCRMFQNSNAATVLAGKPEGMQEDIIIQGRGRALLDGGVHNGLREDTAGKDGMPNIFNNLTIYLHNVVNFKIDGLTIRDQRWWAIAFAFASQGIVSNIRFEITDKSWRKGHPLNPDHPWRNQDGIDLRVGCHDIQIFNITGETCDDVVALTALAEQGTNMKRFEDIYHCHHLSSDIYNVSIRNINAFNNHCAIIRLLCHFGNKIFNISIDEIIDATPIDHPVAVEDGQRTACCVKVGENGYHRNIPELGCKHGDLSNIRISNVYSNALTAVNLNCTARDVIIRDIQVGEKGINAVSASLVTGGKHTALDKKSNTTYLENVLIDGVFYRSEQENATPFFFNNLTVKNVHIRNVNASCEELVCNLQRCEDSEQIIYE
jgi:hypothetical protein